MRVLLADDSLPHQIRLRLAHNGSQIAVSCTCQRMASGAHRPLAQRVRWEAADALAAWRTHIEAGGEPVALLPDCTV